jgi:hypothetical protein
MMLHDLLPNLPSVSLKELDCVSLQNRIDSKYLLNSALLEQLLPFIAMNYKILEIEGHRIFTYENNYFDTTDLLFYHEHHNGYLNRIKVRSRKYLETGNCYFEIKKKEKIDRTNKIREKTDELISIPTADMLDQIAGLSRKSLNGIHKVLSNHFNRITFTNNSATERMTLDFNISFADEQQEKMLDDVFVLEIKQSKSSGHSSINEIIKENNIREQGFSKYVYGVMLLKNGIKKNNFLPLLKKINSLH